jgi:hypothetical protein
MTAWEAKQLFLKLREDRRSDPKTSAALGQQTVRTPAPKAPDGARGWIGLQAPPKK